MSPDFSAALATRFQRGDEGALVEMYALYSGPMFVTALSLVGDREMAAEAVQQAFVQAWRASSAFDTSRELQPWLYAITRRTAIDVYRRNAVIQACCNSMWHKTRPCQVTRPQQAWQAWQVRQALDQLPTEERDVLHLAYFESLMQSEISRQLNVPLGTVKSRTSRAQRKLVQSLAHLMDETCNPAGVA